MAGKSAVRKVDCINCIYMHVFSDSDSACANEQQDGYTKF